MRERREIMNIYSAPGTKVRFLNKNGYEYDLEHARKYLNTNRIYTVRNIDVGGWSSTVYLEEVPGEYFNTVCFKEVSLGIVKKLGRKRI